jgi:hypothetical protein
LSRASSLVSPHQQRMGLLPGGEHVRPNCSVQCRGTCPGPWSPTTATGQAGAIVEPPLLVARPSPKPTTDPTTRTAATRMWRNLPGACRPPAEIVCSMALTGTASLGDRSVRPLGTDRRRGMGSGPGTTTHRECVLRRNRSGRSQVARARSAGRSCTVIVRRPVSIQPRARSWDRAFTTDSREEPIQPASSC